MLTAARLPSLQRKYGKIRIAEPVVRIINFAESGNPGYLDIASVSVVS